MDDETAGKVRNGLATGAVVAGALMGLAGGGSGLWAAQHEAAPVDHSDCVSREELAEVRERIDETGAAILRAVCRAHPESVCLGGD